MSTAGTTTLAQFQDAFARALFAAPGDAHPSIAALVAQPAFAVYRNTVMKACVDALEANYPSVALLVGTQWFRSAAALHVAAHPPRDGRLVQYGEGFARFLADFEPAAGLPYLAGVAQLDRFWTESHIAADAATLDPASLAQLAPETLAGTVLAPHPSARWAWFADMPVFSIWQCNRVPVAASQDEDIPWQGEGALVTRVDDAVRWQFAGRADGAFLESCAQGECLGQAAERAMAVDSAVDLAALLSRLLQAGAFCAAT